MLLVIALRLEMWVGQFTSGPGLLNSSLFTFWEAESSDVCLQGLVSCPVASGIGRAGAPNLLGEGR